MRPHIASIRSGDTQWAAFLARLDYLQIDVSQPAAFAAVTSDARHAERHAHLLLGDAPSLFVPICEGLAAAGLTGGARVVLEKPLGYDLASSNEINDAVGRIFAEDQIYRIDHYLGKEAVQNLFALRFGNSLFEPLWRREWVESIQITVAEQLGVETRGSFYDQTGTMRDMVQNHLLQLLSIIAMEPPQSMDADAVRGEKLRVLRSLKPLSGDDIRRNVVRGQYHAGAINGSPVRGYLAESGVRRAA
ncbi:hypothetical protein AB1286_32645 [Trinickia sp. NRRL B-1857]|uniref:hypothetical protein n=1 Tax=Trinickia sp. NRRL B-1857 TaxID=3162879 RepID=UPI003D2CD777